MNGEADHIHLSFDAPPQIQLSKMINSYKTGTSRLIRKEFAEHLQKFYWKPYFWSQSYMVLSTGGATIDVIKKYIEDKEKKKRVDKRATKPHQIGDLEGECIAYFCSKNNLFSCLYR
ncbi:IS200/IS605 family transposase [Ectobacillus sp. sgz5001026]|uniref:IS200/IS605 family transposase n=1 Tax=Ectobacillus sp. sgz5001026 TaxID=3242473 RepID=UPI0036D3ECBD